MYDFSKLLYYIKYIFHNEFIIKGYNSENFEIKTLIKLVSMKQNIIRNFFETTCTKGLFNFHIS